MMHAMQFYGWLATITIGCTTAPVVNDPPPIPTNEQDDGVGPSGGGGAPGRRASLACRPMA